MTTVVGVLLAIGCSGSGGAAFEPDAAATNHDASPMVDDSPLVIDALGVQGSCCAAGVMQ